MTKQSGKYSRMAVLAIAMGGTVWACAPSANAAELAPGAGANPAAASGQSTEQGATNAQAATAALKAKLHDSKFKDVQASVDGAGIATLSGTVQLYEYKVEADRRAHDVKGVVAVRNNVEVAGNIPDSEIEKKLGPQLAYSREGYGNLFDAIIMHVQNGVVTLSGHSHDYPDRDAAVALAATTPGVKQVIDDIQVDPVSQMDWGIRMAVAKAIYGYGPLQKYAINPIRPIRISVHNGHVELYGTVDNQQDKQIAYMRAQAVPDVFSVKNYIQVEGQPAGKQESESPQK